MSPSTNTGAPPGGAPGGLHLTANPAASATTNQSVQPVQNSNVLGGGGGLGAGISNDGLSSSFNPANPLQGIYSPKTSHLSIVQQQLEQVKNFDFCSYITYLSY